MEPNRLDQEIKNKLDKRVISPSSNSWETLSNRLDTQVEKRNNKGYWWFGLAASVVGVLLVVTPFNDKGQNVEESPKVVAAPIDDLKIETVNTGRAYNVLEREDVIEKSEVFNDSKNLEKPILKENISFNNSNSTVAKTPKRNENSVTEVKGVDEQELTFEEQKIQEVVAQVQALKDEKRVVTEADLDALLISAQNEIALNKFALEVNGRVDANALLESVEQELDQSFRSKVLKAIKTSYNSVKTAIATRNE